MKAGGGSKKGGRFEREIADQLSLWWTHNKRDDIFWRTPGSGGRATTRKKAGLATAGSTGDIQAIDPIGEPLLRKVCFELKIGYGVTKIDKITGKKVKVRWDLLNVIDSTKQDATQVFIEFVLQAQEAAGDRWGVVIFQRDSRCACIAVPDDMWMYMRAQIGETTELRDKNINDCPIMALHHKSIGKYIIFRFADFMAYFNPEIFIAKPKRTINRVRPHSD